MADKVHFRSAWIKGLPAAPAGKRDVYADRGCLGLFLRATAMRRRQLRPPDCGGVFPKACVRTQDLVEVKQAWESMRQEAGCWDKR